MALRSALGALAEELIVADAASIALQPSGRLTIDVAAIEAARRSRTKADLERAFDAYRGDFLAGLNIPVAPFNDWLLLERQRLSSLHSDQLAALVTAQAEAGELEKAGAAAKALVQHDPLREEGHRLLMRLYYDTGQRAAALKQYDILKRLLHEELGIAPEAETVELADRLRTGHAGARVDAVERPRGSASPVTQADPIPKATGPAAHRGPSLPDKPSIVVLPFKNLSGDPAQDMFVDGLVDDMTIALGREKWLFVISPSSAVAFKGQDDDLKEIAAKLGVRYALRGSVRRSGDRYRIVVLLSDAASGEFIWSDRFEDAAANLFDMSDRLMTHVAAMIAPALRSVEIERAQRRPPAQLSAFELYLQSLPKLRMDLAQNRQALKLLEQAVAADPSYSLAYALAARCYHFQRHMGWVHPSDPEMMQRGAGFTRLAIELGQNDSEALWMAAHAATHLTGEIDHAAELIERSLSLNPNSASAWTSSCHIQNCMGRFDLAIEHFQRSQRLNPMDHMHHLHWNIVGISHFGAGRMEDADAAADKALQVSPAYPQALRLKIATCGALRRPELGRQYVQRLLAVHPDCSLQWLEAFYALLKSKVPQLVDDFIACSGHAGLPDLPRQNALTTCNVH